MTREQAMREAAKRWGKKALVRAHDKISSPERRQEAKDKYKAIEIRIEQIDTEVKARLAELDWYQNLMAERKQCSAQRRDVDGWRDYHKFSVGQDLGYAFYIIGSGDTWEEAFAQADERSKAS